MSDQGSAATDETDPGAPSATDAPADVTSDVHLPDEALRQALELAFAVAVAGTRLKPAIAPPSSLRRYLKFQKLPTGALGPVRKAIEDDRAFRERTARVATDELVGPLGRLWLSRPEGWLAQLNGLIPVEAVGQPATDRSAERRREAAESALARIRAENVGLQAEITRLLNRVTDAETSAAVAVEEVAKLHSEAERLKAAGDRRRERARVAEEDRDRARRDLLAATERMAQLEHLLEEALAARQVAEARGTAETRPRPVPPVVSEAPAPHLTPFPSSSPPSPSPPVPAAPVLDEAWVAAGASLAGRLSDAAGALGLLGAELAAALSALAKPGAPPRPALTSRAATQPSRPGFPPAFPPEGVTPLAKRTETSGRRQPLAIPGGLLDDSAEVAFHLIRHAGVTTIVDGYNVAKLGWPDLALADQRECCLDGVEDLVRRYGIRAQVVFDGASVIGVGSGRRLVRVSFTPTGVSADDEIRGLVRELPVDQGIVVVTNDREIIRAVRLAGANVVSSEQFLAVIRRTP